jgi:cytochrome c556
MKAGVAGFQGANGALKAGSAADAKTQLAAAKQNYTLIQQLFESKKITDASDLAKGLLAQIDAADKALSGATPDTMAAMAALKQGSQACGACHKLYREGDGKGTPYSIKAGVF